MTTTGKGSPCFRSCCHPCPALLSVSYSVGQVGKTLKFRKGQRHKCKGFSALSYPLENYSTGTKLSCTSFTGSYIHFLTCISECLLSSRNWWRKDRALPSDVIEGCVSKKRCRDKRGKSWSCLGTITRGTGGCIMSLDFNLNDSAMLQKL